MILKSKTNEEMFLPEPFTEHQNYLTFATLKEVGPRHAGQEPQYKV